MPEGVVCDVTPPGMPGGRRSAGGRRAPLRARAWEQSERPIEEGGLMADVIQQRVRRDIDAALSDREIDLR